MEHRLGVFTGSLVVIDELKEASAATVADFIHRISDNKGKGRFSARDNGVKARQEWSLVALSTGEVSIASYLGQRAQGGHLVRMIDVGLGPGEACLDERHALEVEAWTRQNAGVLGERWARLLGGWGQDEWERLAKECEALASKAAARWQGQEIGRVIRALSVLGACWDRATRAGIWGRIESGDLEGEVVALGAEGRAWSGEDLVFWLLDRVAVGRDRAGKTPEERLFVSLLRLYDSQPERFPTTRSYDAREGRNVVGIVDASAGEARTVLTTGQLLEASGVCGDCACQPEDFFDWAKDRGIAQFDYEKDAKGNRRIKRTRPPGLPTMQRGWVRLRLDAGLLDDGEGQDGT